VIYTLASWTILMAIGPTQLFAVLTGDVSQLVFGLNTDFVSQAMTDVMQVLVVTSFVAGVLALQNAGSRYLLSMSRRGMLPAVLSTTGPSGSPRAAVLVQGGLVTAALVAFGLSSLDPYTQVVIWTNTPTLFAVLALQIATSIAVIRWFARIPMGESTWTRLVAPALATLILATVLWMAVDNMGLLTMLGSVGNALIILPLVVAAVFGAVRAGTTQARATEEPAAPTPVGERS
jgi:amino acid transporter